MPSKATLPRAGEPSDDPFCELSSSASSFNNGVPQHDKFEAENVTTELDRSEFLDRIDTARKKMEEAKLDALIAYSNHVHVLPGNVRYFANYFATEEEQTVVVITADQSMLLTDTVWYADRARETCPIEVKGNSNLAKGITEIFRQSKIRRGSVGIAGWRYLPATIFLGLKDELPNIDFNATNIVNEMRAVKSPGEIRLLREAARCTDMYHEAAMRAIEAGKKEWEIVAAAESAILFSGAQVSIVNEFGSGSRTLLNSPIPTNKELKHGDLCLLDGGASYQGYHGDITRMKVVGQPSPKQRELLEFEAETLKQAIAAIRPGIKCSQVNSIAKKPIKEEGYEEWDIKHGGWIASGHSIGLEVHEYPTLGMNEEASDVPLKENMVLCLEPSFTVPEGNFRLEDTVLVTADGCEKLTKCRIDWWT